MDDGEAIVFCPNKNQDGSQPCYILVPCSSGGCVDDPLGIELIDLTEEYQAENTGNIALLSTSSTGGLEIRLKNSEEEMDSKNLSEIKKFCEDTGSSSDNSITIIDMISDDGRKRPVKVEDEDVDVEEISSIHDISTESSVIEHKSEPELVDISEGGEELQHSQNDQDDDTEEGALYIDDAKYTELQEELAEESLQDLNNFKENVMQNIEGPEITANTVNVPERTPTAASDEADDVEIIECIENKQGKLMEVISLSFDVVSGPTYTQSTNKNIIPKEAFVHGQVIEIPSGKQPKTDTDVRELNDSTNTALTLLELAGSTGNSLMEVEIIEKDCCQKPIQDPCEVDAVEETSLANEEPTLATLQPVQLDPPISSVPFPENSNAKSEIDNVVTQPPPKAKTDTSSTPKAPVIRMTPEELVQRLKDGDSPRQLLGKDSRRGRDTLYMSPLVTRAEIAQEFMDRQLQKTPYTEPSSGDYIFAMKLAHRLATKIVPPEVANPQAEEAKSEDASVKAKPQNSLNSSEIDAVSKTNIESGKGLKKSYAISDKIELLKILEDDPDDPPSSNTNQIILEQKMKSDRKKSQHAPLIKMHPELEKELALKQLQDFNQVSGRGKKRVSFNPDSKQIKVEKNHEHNNNFNSAQKQTNGTKKRVSELQGKSSKRIKKEDSVTADPSQITETLTVEGQTLIDDLSTKDGKLLKQYSNKRLSRSSETPPRHLPMDIVLNGIDDLPKKEETTKNKIFKATNPRKRKEELQEKRQKHFTNVFQKNKPQKKRGRPPKKKSYPTNDELNKEFLLKASLEPENATDGNHQDNCNQETTSPETDDKPVKTKKMREIERLLGDEGAINMLYSVEQKRASGGESKRGMLPSYRRKKKDLILKTKLVKSAVLRLTTNPPLTTGRISLRGQAPKEGEIDESDKSSSRKMSVDSHDSLHSLSSPPHESFSFPPKIVPAEASRIIRRHSSSSNYSSRSNSPRRLSVDGERINILSPEAKTIEEEQIDQSIIGSSKQKQVKTSHQISAESMKKPHDKSDKLLMEKTKDTINKDHTPQLKSTLDSKNLSTSIKSKSKVPVKIESPRLRGRRRIFMKGESKTSTELNTSLAAAVEDFAKENKSGGKNIPVETPKKLTSSAVPTPKAVYRKSADTPRTRTPKPSKVYKELTLKRHDQVVEISLTPASTTLHNAFNTNVLHELTSVLPGLSKDDNCHVVLITSQGAVFCQGVDFPALVKPIPDERKVAALEMGVAIKEFVKSIAMLARPVVVAVHAPVVGLGVTLLPLCDVVLAAENATFYTPYTRLGHVPEGAATLTFPSLLGHSVTSELLFACRKFTAPEAQQAGLVMRVLPEENFYEEVLSIAKAMSSQSAQAMNATKVLLRHGLLTGLETTLVSETHLLTKHWVSPECQTNFTSALDKGEYVLASPPTPTSTSTSVQSNIEVGSK